VTKALIGFIIGVMILTMWVSVLSAFGYFREYKAIANKDKQLCYLTDDFRKTYTTADVMKFVQEHNKRMKMIQTYIVIESILTGISAYCFLSDLQYFGIACPVHTVVVLSALMMLLFDFFSTHVLFFKYMDDICSKANINNNGKVSFENISSSGYMAILVSVGFSMFKAVY
jgi:hypothetical protein